MDARGSFIIGLLVVLGLMLGNPGLARAASCGNGVVEQGELCDDGVSPDRCMHCEPSICTVGAVEVLSLAYGACGSDAECGPAASCRTDVCTPSRCSNNCAQCTSDCLGRCVSNQCGDGDQDRFELCDDGNTLDGDGCSASCDLEGFSPQGREYCADAAGTVSPDPSSNACTNSSQCGTGNYCDTQACTSSACSCVLFEGWSCTGDCAGTCRAVPAVPALGDGPWFGAALSILLGACGWVALNARRRLTVR